MRFFSKPTPEQSLFKALMFSNEAEFYKALESKPEINSIDSDVFKKRMVKTEHPGGGIHGVPVMHCTPLMWAILGRQYYPNNPEETQAKIVSELINRGADVNFKVKNPPYISGSILQNAVRYSTPKIVEILINAGADINILSEDKCNILELANQRAANNPRDSGAMSAFLSRYITSLHKKSLYTALAADNLEVDAKQALNSLQTTFFRSRLFDEHLINEAITWIEEPDSPKP